MRSTFLFLSPFLFAVEEPVVYHHDDIQQFSMHGNFQKALSSKKIGANEFEVWRTSLAVGSKTPLHAHETEEVFIVLTGTILAKVGEQEVTCEAPATLICPANIPHQLFNIGEIPTDQIVIMGINSKIYNQEGKEMDLPWRKE